MSRIPVRVLCAAEMRDPGWRWLEPAFSREEVAFEIHDFARLSKLENLVTRPCLPRYRVALTAAIQAIRGRADLLVTCGPGMSCWTELACRASSRARPPHLAFAFNFTNLPTGTRRGLFRKALRTVDRFVVASTTERNLYSEYLDLDPDRFDVLLWGIQKPHVPEDAQAFLPGDYVCAIGGEGRDYSVLFDAARLLPNVRLAVVARPHNVAGLDVPSNVMLHTNIPSETCWNILKFSRFSIVPLRDSQVPCGHVTLVASMYHRKALVVTNSEGVRDYVRHDDNALLVPPSNSKAIAEAIELLYADSNRAERMGIAGEHFAYSRCSETSTSTYLRNHLAGLGLA